MTYRLRDGSSVDDRRFNRLTEFDPRSRAFGVARRLAEAPRQPVTRYWSCPLVLDQGQEGSCVGNGFAHEAAAEPVAVPGITERFAHDTIYWGAQRHDGIPGGSYPGAQPFGEGTSVLAGAKQMLALGFYRSYHWAFSEAEVALAISYLGPVVLGLPWYAGMYHPDRQGYLNPTGAVVGGHCILATGYDSAARAYTLHNSWGPGWGRGGTAQVRADDLAGLLAQRGEACVPDGRRMVQI